MSEDAPTCTHEREDKNENLVDCKGKLLQVPVVAICHAGHMQDFPWAEWVHKSVAPSCGGLLKLEARSGSSLTGMTIKCKDKDCKRERNLANILKEGFITRSLATGSSYPCQGGRPWLGIRGEGAGACDRDLKGSLRTSSNVYFPSIRSSLRLPLERLSERTSIWGRMCEDINIGPYVSFAKSTFVDGIEPSKEDSFIEAIRERDQNNTLTTVDDSLIIEVFNMHCRGESMEEEFEGDDEDRDIRLRREEFNVLASEVKEEVLRSKRTEISNTPLLAKNFYDIYLVDSLEEIRALIGFTRIHSFSGAGDFKSMARLMWKDRPGPRVRNWLPAYRVKGEGILFLLKEEKIGTMEQESVFSDKVAVLNHRKDQRPFHQHDISSRLLVVHTFAHLIIKQLVFYCGYPAASLRERLYISDDEENPMSAVMIYTASGDSQGSMGGLVKIGEPDNLFEPLNQAIENAKWCSSDPVCMEVGNQQGQGQYGLNLAACHDCCLLPNTSCELFNNFLDRTFLIGDGSSVKGYFDR